MTPIVVGAVVVAGILVVSRVMASHTPGPTAAPTALGEATLAVALRELGVSEDLGKNDGQRIRDYWVGTGNGPPANWCAVFLMWCMREASAESGFPLVVEGSVGAKATMEQFRGLGRWVPVEVLRREPHLLAPGMVPVWDRSVAGRPETSWWGHIGVSFGGCDPAGRFHSVEGNSGADGARVADVLRGIWDPRLLGVGIL